MLSPGADLQVKVVVRTDASAQIGTGHFARCLTLANAMRARGAETTFVARHLAAGFGDRLKAEGHRLHLIEGGGHPDELAHSSWLGGAQTFDAEQTLRLLTGAVVDWIVVDHYALDARWERQVRSRASRLLAIDDLADRAHDVDLLVDQNFYPDSGERYAALLSARCRPLLGPRFAMLRPEFLQARALARVRCSGVRKILIFFGGVDVTDATGRVIDALDSAFHKAFALVVVIGGAHPRREDIVRKCAERDHECHVQTDRMAELMVEADLSIGASGSATWERCAVGLPAIMLSLAQNQRAIAQGVVEQGAALYAGEDDAAAAVRVVSLVEGLIKDNEKLAAISTAALSLVDARGTDRVVNAMLSVS
jgi:UDP-2,4-diacetamido-2,4,6-trideoxy-beta-L-altropyranose hydrolase